MPGSVESFPELACLQIFARGVFARDVPNLNFLRPSLVSWENVYKLDYFDVSTNSIVTGQCSLTILYAQFNRGVVLKIQVDTSDEDLFLCFGLVFLLENDLHVLIQSLIDYFGYCYLQAEYVWLTCSNKMSPLKTRNLYNYVTGEIT